MDKIREWKKINLKLVGFGLIWEKKMLLAKTRSLMGRHMGNELSENLATDIRIHFSSLSTEFGEEASKANLVNRYLSKMSKMPSFVLNIYDLHAHTQPNYSLSSNVTFVRVPVTISCLCFSFCTCERTLNLWKKKIWNNFKSLSLWKKIQH